MMRFEFRRSLAASALAAGLAFGAPAAAADGPGYDVVGASQARVNYAYLTIDSVLAKLRPAVAAQLPPASGARLVILNVMFRTTGDADKMAKLTPSDLQVQWDADGARGAAPVLGAHISKDFWALGPGGGFYTSMRPDKYELFAIVPRSVRHIDLAHRQPDGSFKPVKSRIALSAPR